MEICERESGRLRPTYACHGALLRGRGHARVENVIGDGGTGALGAGAGDGGEVLDHFLGVLRLSGAGLAAEGRWKGRREWGNKECGGAGKLLKPRQCQTETWTHVHRIDWSSRSCSMLRYAESAMANTWGGRASRFWPL